MLCCNVSDDPTRTLTLRNKAVAEITRRFKQLNRLIIESVKDNKIFLDNAQALKKEEFIFLRDGDKLKKFDAWLQGAISEIILSGSVRKDDTNINWLLAYIDTAYRKGIKKSTSVMQQRLGKNVIPDLINLVNLPPHARAMELIFTRDFDQLKGITEAMSQQISYIISEGILQGENPNDMAKRITDRVEKIGITRAKLLARTEVINAFNLARINNVDAYSDFLGEEVVFRWISGVDARVRDTHRERNNKFYSKEKVTPLIGEPNCRCTITEIPVSLLELVYDNPKVLR
jgi:SPP1 gp7 family putative phage head morphogenesis protein